MKHLPIRAVITAIFCNILFGSAVPMIKYGYAAFSITDDMYAKILFAGVRFFISGILVWLVASVKRRSFPTVPNGGRLWVAAVALTYTFLQYLFNYIGLSNTTGSLASVIVASSSFISVILAHFLYKDDKLNMQKVLGSIVGVIGVILTTVLGKSIGGISFLGEGFLLISAVCFVIGSAFNKQASKFTDSFTITAYNLLLGGGLLIIAALVGYRGGIVVTGHGILILLYLILVSSVGFTIWSTLLSRYPIGKLGVYLFIIPVSGAILSGLLLGENIFTLPYLFSFVLVSIGIITVNYRPKHTTE